VTSSCLFPSDPVDALCRERCAGAGLVVASVEYRLAPEFKFPVPVDDCYAALCWLHAEHERLGVDPAKISIGGASSGANLAAAMTLKARAEGAPPIHFQLLEVPALDLTGGHLDDIDLGEPPSRAEIQALYLADATEADNPLVSPLLAGDLSGLPPAHIMSAELDHLRGDARAYAARLADAGVPVTIHQFPGHLHMTPLLTRTFEPAKQWRTEAITQLREAHRARPSTS
jgi:acetyl esterase